jgi:hypothetical protein
MIEARNLDEMQNFVISTSHRSKILKLIGLGQQCDRGLRKSNFWF